MITAVYSLVKSPFDWSTSAILVLTLTILVQHSNPDTVGISVDPNNGVVYVADSSLSAVPHSKHHQLLRIDCNALGKSSLVLRSSLISNTR